jgi:flagellar biosynthesis protein FlhG
MTKADQAAGLRLARESWNAEPRVVPSSTRAPLSFAITSGKGGVGKTQIAANLAVCFARRGHKLLLLDADLGLAGLDLALGVTPVHTLNAVLEGEKQPEEITVEGPCGVRLLPACPGRYEMANLSPNERDALTNAIDACAAHYSVVLTDTGAGINSNSVSFAAGADEVILVVTPDPTSIRDAYAMAKVLTKRAGVETLRLIANKVGSVSQGAEVHATLRGLVRRFLPTELTYLGCVPRDDAMRQCGAMGTPIVLRSPESIAARSIQAIAQRLLSLPSAEVAC